MLPSKFQRIEAFTLIELSIVLVIIGLIVAGIMVGQDLINSARIRAQISQIENLNTAVTTFKLKYNGIPGDLLYSQASEFGIFSSVSGYGNGDGTIHPPIGISREWLSGEPLIFYRQLSDTNLINGSYNNTGIVAGTINPSGSMMAAPTTLALVNAHIPPAKVGQGSSLTIGSVNGFNYYAIAGIPNLLNVGGDYDTTVTNPLTGKEAYIIDIKMDDGVPGSGTVFAIDASGNTLRLPATWSTVSAVSDCVTGSSYVLNSPLQGCSLRFKMH